MKTSPPELPGWSRRRFWGFVVVLFVAQAGLILLFAEGGRGLSRLAPGPVHFRLWPAPLTSDQLTRTFFAVDPTVFTLPSLNGFSDQAWLQSSSAPLAVPEEKEPPAWLAIDAVRLGTNFPVLNRPESPLPFNLAGQSGAELEQWPPALPPESFSNQSAFELQGELASRQLNPPSNLRTWPSTVLLSNTVVQIAVNSSGQVVAARLLGRSGLIDADTNALDKARNLRFRPSATGAPVWGDAVFEWQTAGPTNPAPASAP